MEKIQEMIELFNSGIDMTNSALAIAAYILSSLAIFTIAKRRCIKKPWMAWVPVVNVWIVGSIADQYRYVTKREVKNNRKVLLALSIAMTALCAALIVLICVLIFRLRITAGINLDGLIRAFQNGNFEFLVPYAEYMAVPILSLLFLLLAMSAVAVAYSVIYYMTLYDVYKSCIPNRSKMFLLLSIFGNLAISGVEAVFLMICRNKDQGMPPRKADVAPAEQLPLVPTTEEVPPEQPISDVE